MTAGLGWLSAFPQVEAHNAVRAVRQSWTDLAAKRRDHFNPREHEPKLTRVLRSHVQRVTARDLGLLGYWGTEGVENEVDLESGEILGETRTDILYAWNDDARSLRLVFEFKKLNHQASSRDKYLGQSGLLRFVTGPYSQKQSVAIMAGILTSDPEQVVPAMRRALQHPSTAGVMRMVKKADGSWLHAPSSLFPGEVDFDSEHLRPAELGPEHGTIYVSHMFLSFGYPLPQATVAKRKSTLDALEKE